MRPLTRCPSADRIVIGSHAGNPVDWRRIKGAFGTGSAAWAAGDGAAVAGRAAPGRYRDGGSRTPAWEVNSATPSRYREGGGPADAALASPATVDAAGRRAADLPAAERREALPAASRAAALPLSATGCPPRDLSRAPRSPRSICVSIHRRSAGRALLQMGPRTPRRACADMYCRARCSATCAAGSRGRRRGGVGFGRKALHVTAAVGGPAGPDGSPPVNRLGLAPAATAPADLGGRCTADGR